MHQGSCDLAVNTFQSLAFSNCYGDISVDILELYEELVHHQMIKQDHNIDERELVATR